MKWYGVDWLEFYLLDCLRVLMSLGLLGYASWRAKVDLRQQA
jgi:hypothetical protein